MNIGQFYSETIIVSGGRWTGRMFRTADRLTSREVPYVVTEATGTRQIARSPAARGRNAALDCQLERLINLLMVIEGNAELAIRNTGNERRTVALSRVMTAADRAAMLAHEMLATVLQED